VQVQSRCRGEDVMVQVHHVQVQGGMCRGAGGVKVQVQRCSRCWRGSTGADEVQVKLCSRCCATGAGAEIMQRGALTSPCRDFPNPGRKSGGVFQRAAVQVPSKPKFPLPG